MPVHRRDHCRAPNRSVPCLYVLGTETPLHFLNGGRALSSVRSRNVKLFNDLQRRHGSKYKRVSDYYVAHRHLVAIEDVSHWVPELVTESAEIEEESEPA